MKLHTTEIVDVAAKGRNFHAKPEGFTGHTESYFQAEQRMGASLNIRDLDGLCFQTLAPPQYAPPDLNKLAPDTALARMIRANDKISEGTLRELLGAAFEGMSD